MKKLILAAQSGDSTALADLCLRFKPLLTQEAHREMFYRSLGKDADGIAALAFIELVLGYNGCDYDNWPGLARCRVHYALFDAMRKRGKVWDNEVIAETLEEEENSSLAGSYGIERELLTLYLLEALRKLTQRQQQIICGIYFKGLTEKQLAERFKCSQANIHKHRARSLNCLKTLLAS